MTEDKKSIVYQVIKNVEEKDLPAYTFKGETWKHVLSSPYLISSKGRIYNPKEKIIYTGLTLEEYFEVQEMM